jgi:putative isomerase
MISFDLTRVPFTREGSRFSFRDMLAGDGKPAGIYLTYIPKGPVFYVEVLKGGHPVEFTRTASPQALILEAAGGRIEIIFESAGRLRFRVQGLTFKFGAGGGAFNYVLPRGENRWQVNMFHVRCSFLVTCLQGTVITDAPWQITRAEYIDVRMNGEKGVTEAALETFLTVAPPPLPVRAFDELKAQSTVELEAFTRKLPEVPAEFQAARELAGYILWSSLIPPDGPLRRRAMLMSKNHMTRVWSWDHCFNAMALAAGDPDLAFDQWAIVFDQQDASGCLPDSIDNVECMWNFCKPPIHGWSLMKMVEANPALAKRLPEAYAGLGRWTDWWMTTRDDDGDGMPQYNHGNDSGWDNATCFDIQPPVEGPDLAAFLITQMDALAEIADRLHRPDESRQWRQRADRLFETLLKHSWTGEKFQAKHNGSHETPTRGDSLIPFMLLILGKRLPADIRKKLIDGVGTPGRFITEWGPATESPNSPLYESDGYWRGPIWAPSTHILYEGLIRCGEKKLARDIALRFCRLCAKSGMAENYDALTGAPLRDKAYTWTSSVFLLLAHDLTIHD